MELQAVTKLLNVVDGEKAKGVIPGLLAMSTPPGAARGRAHDRLFIHIAATADIDHLEVLYQDLLDSLSDTFYQTGGSVTAALRKAIIATNQLLLEHNLSGVGANIEGSVTCVVQHGQELFIAQAGEAFVYIGHNFGIEQLSSADSEQSTPLGRTSGLDIRFNHSRLSDGDLILLADPRLAHIPTEDLKPVLIDVPVSEATDALAGLVGADSARAILVEFSADTPASLPGNGRHRSSYTSARILGPPTTAPVREQVVPSPPAHQAEIAVARPNFDVDLFETSARKATARAAQGMSRGTGWFADLLSKVRSPDRPEPAEGSLAIPTIIALVIPIIVAVIVVGVYIQRGRVAQLNDAKNEIKGTLNEASLLADPALAVSMYNEALELISEAEDAQPEDTELASMRQEAIDGIDRLAGVERLPSSLLYQFDAGTTLASIVVDNEQLGIVYVLDTGGRMVVKLATEDSSESLTGEPTLLLRGDQVVGNYIVGSPMDMMWRPGGNQVTRDGLAVLDERGALVTFFPDFSDLRAVSLDLASQWVSPVAIASFNERLYIVDPGTPAIWRYYPEGEGFKIIEGQESLEFVDEADLAHVIDMAIYNEDGSIVLLYDDGRLRRYASGRLLWDENDLQENGMNLPFISPVSLKIIGGGLNSSIYVADPGSNRIVQLSLGGTYLAQFKATDEFGNELFSQISDFDIAGNTGAIFAVADNGIYVVTGR